MALWAKTDASGSAPKYTTSADNGDKGADDFGTTVFGVDTAESQAQRAEGTPVSPGWVKRVAGTGGRAGRVLQETLVAMSNQGGISTDAEDVAFPDLAIAIVTQPVAASVTSPAAATFTVVDSTTPTGGATTYQWQVSTDGGSNWASSTSGGNTTDTLTVSNGEADYVDANQFRVVVSATGADSETSTAALLTVV